MNAFKASLHPADVSVHVASRREQSVNGAHSRPGSAESSHVEGLLHLVAEGEDGVLHASNAASLITLQTTDTAHKRPYTICRALHLGRHCTLQSAISFPKRCQRHTSWLAGRVQGCEDRALLAGPDKLERQAEAGELLGLQRLYVCTALSNQPNGGLAEPLKVNPTATRYHLSSCALLCQHAVLSDSY